ncbi:transglycosylase SLT domain-containing protein [Priestia megaterium]
MKQATDQKIKELQNSLTPLGISLARAQGAWAQALGPFVDIWGRIAAKVLDASTAIANFINRMNQVNDDISQMGGMFAYLATAISLILSPMAIGIGRAAGFAAAFGSIWMIAGPLILGLTRIAGIATVLSAAIVVVSGTLMKMWSASENLRNSVASLGTVLQIGFQQNIARIQPAINQLKAAIDRLLVSIFGSSKAGDIFKRMGDVIGNVITWLTRNVLPIFMTVMRNVFTVAGQAIQGLASFIVKIAPQVGQMVQSIVGFIKTLVATVTNGNTVIGKIFQVTWTVIAFILKGAWQNIKGIITSGIAIITNIFQLFTNLLQGNWKAAFGNLVAIVKNVLIFIWNYINLMALGRILGIFKSFFVGGIALFKSGFGKISFNVQYFMLAIREFIEKTYTRLTTATGNAFKSMLNWARSILSSMWSFIRSIFGTIYNFYVNIMRRIYVAFMNGWNGVKSATLSFLKTVYGFIQSYFKYIYNFYWNILRRIYQIFNANWRNIYNFTVNIFKSVYKFLANIFGSIYRTISGAVTKTRQWVSNGWNSLWSQTKTIFGNIKKWTSNTFDDIVSGAKKLPGRIGQGIKSMSKYAKDGAIAMANTLASALGKGVNGAIDGINWVLDKIGVDDKKQLKKWTVPHYRKGTSEHKGGWFVAGDGNAEELIRFPDGRMTLSPSTDTLYYGEKGTEVLSGPDTKKLLSTGLIPGYDSGVGAAIKKKAKEWLGAAKSTAGAAKDKVKSTAKKAKDVALDVWEYMEKPKELMAKVFAKYIPDIGQVGGSFTDIAKGSISYIKDKAVDYIKKQFNEGGGGAFTGKIPAGSGVKRWAGIASQALRMTGQYTKANLDRLLYQMQTESGGNPRSINLWDINATKYGTPSKGLMQVIDPTFRSFAMPGFNKNIYDPLSNMLASIRYAVSRYGSLARAYSGHGYKMGGIINSPEIAALAENGKPEAVVPLVGRAMDPFAVGVARKLGELFVNNGQGDGSGSPYVFQVNLNGRKIAEEVFSDINELQQRSETRTKRSRGEVDY